MHQKIPSKYFLILSFQLVWNFDGERNSNQNTIMYNLSSNLFLLKPLINQLLKNKDNLDINFFSNFAIFFFHKI